VKVVLDIQAGEGVAIVLILPVALLEAAEFAFQEIVDIREAKGALAKVPRIGYVNAARFDDPAETKIVPSKHPAHVVAPGEIVAFECRVRVVPETETRQARDADALNRLPGRLIDIDSQIADARHIGGGSAVRGLARKAESEVVEHTGAEGVCFVDQVVLIDDPVCSIGVGQDIGRLKDRFSSGLFRLTYSWLARSDGSRTITVVSLGLIRSRLSNCSRVAARFSSCIGDTPAVDPGAFSAEREGCDCAAISPATSSASTKAIEQANPR